MRLSALTINFFEGNFHITLLFKGIQLFISQLTVRVGNFDYSGKLPLVGQLMFSESCENRVGRSYMLLADNLKFQRTT